MHVYVYMVMWSRFVLKTKNFHCSIRVPLSHYNMSATAVHTEEWKLILGATAVNTEGGAGASFELASNLAQGRYALVLSSPVATTLFGTELTDGNNVAVKALLEACGE